jgi:hypothetical protein
MWMMAEHLQIETPCCPEVQKRAYRSRMLEMPCSCTLPALRGLNMSLLANTTMTDGTISGLFALQFAARYDDAKGTNGLEVSLDVERFGSSRVFEVERQNQARVFWLRSLCGEKSRIGKQTLLGARTYPRTMWHHWHKVSGLLWF